MAFCRNCGSEVSEGTKFCANCGTAVEIKETEVVSNETKDEAFYTSSLYQQKMDPLAQEPVSKLDKFGKFYGIALLILAFVDYNSDPAILTILLSAAIIAGCVFCFRKKYKLKGFTIAALILAVVCLLCGIAQARAIGPFVVPDDDAIIFESPEATSTEEQKMAEESEIAEEKTAVEEIEDTKEDIATEEASSEKKEKVDGVDPDLKEFLDSYEAFMDEYVDFMKKYMENPGNALSMLSEYSEIMEKYEDFAEKVDKYDSDDMSTEDAKYYLEVINRCNQKLLEIY